MYVDFRKAVLYIEEISIFVTSQIVKLLSKSFLLDCEWEHCFHN